MKILVILISIFLLFPILSAVTIDVKSNFSQGETFLAKISGDFTTTLTPENIEFYRRHMQTSIIPKIAQINDEYYFYASLDDKTPDNYSIKISGTSQNFTITNELADFSIDKGFVITSKDFFIEVKNLQSREITIKTNFNDEDNSITVLPQEEEKINFGISDIKETSLQTLQLSSGNLTYEIPVYVFVASSSDEEPEIIEPINKSRTENKTEEIKPPEKEITSVSTTKTCAEMNGKVCEKGEKCNNESVYAKDKVCCLGNCEEIESDTGWKILGWLLLVVVIVFIWFIKRKYSKVENKITFSGISSEKK